MSAKILHVFDHSFPIGDGYAFRSGEILHFLRRNGWETVQVTSAKQGRTGEDCERVDGFDFHRTQPSERLLDRLPLLDQWSVVTTLRNRLDELIARERPQILHAYSPALTGLAALSAARRFGLPLVYEVRTFWEDAAVDKGACREGDLRYRLTRGMETYVCRQADGVVTICEGLRQDLLGRGVDAQKIVTVANSVDVERFGQTHPRDEALAARLDVSAGHTVGFIGSFFAFEGLRVLVDAVPAMLRGDPDLKVVLVGSGVEEEALRRHVRELGVEAHVIFAGRVPHAEVERYYGLLDVLVYPRLSMRITELVTPLKPLEAMAQGRLVLASDVGGHREMVRDGWNGRLFRAGSPGSLADTCLRILAEPERWEEYRQNGRHYVNEERNWAVNIRPYEDIYRALLKA